MVAMEKLLGEAVYYSIYVHEWSRIMIIHAQYCNDMKDQRQHEFFIDDEQELSWPIIKAYVGRWEYVGLHTYSST